jgi:glycosyltransferase involved in cell wall biosynthesis
MAELTAKTATVLVSNDLTHDQRVKKVCQSLMDLGFNIVLVGRRTNASSPIDRPYPCRRFKLGFSGGAGFYAMLNSCLFFYLLFAKTDVIVANDLDTLWPAYLVGKWRKKGVVYDSHEYFTEAAGLTGRSFQKKFWLRIERHIFPKLNRVITVNESIAEIYRKLYGVNVRVIRNMPPRWVNRHQSTREELGLPVDQKLVLLQGAYIDHDRGCLEAIRAFAHIEGVQLLIVGAGQAIPKAKALVHEMKLDSKVTFFDKMPFERLRDYTANVDLGLSLDIPRHLNYKLSLPNKLFDYLQAGTPVLVSRLPELERVLNAHTVGTFIDNHQPEHIAERIRYCLELAQQQEWRKNIEVAAQLYCWESEEKVLREIYEPLL